MTAMKVALKDAAAAHFEPYVGGTFVFQAPPDAAGNPGAQTSMELLLVSLGKKLAIPRHPFSLLFRRISGPELGMELHIVIHEAFEPELMHIARIAPPLDLDPAESYYEAVFS